MAILNSNLAFAIANFSGDKCLGFSNTDGPIISTKCWVWWLHPVVNGCDIKTFGHFLIISENFCSTMYVFIPLIVVLALIPNVDKLITLLTNFLLSVSTIRLKLCRKSVPIIAFDTVVLINLHLKV